jgi:hypothetical protein
VGTLLAPVLDRERALLSATASLVVLTVLVGTLASTPRVLAAPSYDDAPVVCVSSRVEIEVKGGGKLAVSREERTFAVRRVGEDAEGLRGFGVFSSFEFHPTFVELRVHNSEKTKVVRRLHELLDLPAFSAGTFVSDSRQLVTQLPPFQAGDTLQIRKETRLEPFLGFQLHVMGERSYPTLEAIYQVRVDEDLAPQYRIFSGAGEPVEQRKGGKVVWTWRAGPLTPPADEDLSPPIEDLLPTVSVGLNRIAWGPSATWEEIAASYWDHVSEETFAKVDEELTSDRSEAGLPTCELVLSRVQSNVRYVAIELGVGGKIPHAAADVLRRRYGDCKDMAALILSYLRGAGVDGSLAIVRTRPPSGHNVDPLPTLEYFNHAIACTEQAEGTAWLDATARYGTARHPRWDIQGAPTMVVTGPNRGFRRIPMTAAAENRAVRTLRLSEDAAGVWSADLTLVQFGARAQNMNYHLEQGGKPLGVITAYFKSAEIKPTVAMTDSSVRYSNDSPDSVWLRCSVPVIDPTSRKATQAALRPTWDPDPSPISVFKTRERETDVYWSFQEMLVDTLEVRSQRLHFDAPPDTGWTVDAEGVTVAVRSERLPQGFRLTRSITFSRPIFPVARWEEGRELRRRMIRWCTREVSAALL